MGRPRKTAPGLGERLVSLYNSGERATFAKEIGISTTTLGNYERGERRPDTDTLINIREKTGVDLNWLVSGDGSPQSRSPELSSPHLVSLPRFDQQAAAGDGAVVLQDRADGAMLVDANWLARYVPPGSTVSVLEARGESMEPVIRDGDLLLVLHDVDERDVRAGGIFVVTHYGGLKVKRLEGWQGGIRLSSIAGPRYGEEIIPEDRMNDDLIVHGRVFWSGGRLRSA